LLLTGFGPEALDAIARIIYRKPDGRIVSTEGKVTEDLDKIPSIYKTGVLDLDDGRRHTVFLETFRGCPFSRGYCTWGTELNRAMDLEEGIGVDLLLGLPGDDFAGFRRTIGGAITMGIHKFHCSQLLLLPGTRFGNNASGMGLSSRTPRLMS